LIEVGCKDAHFILYPVKLIRNMETNVRRTARRKDSQRGDREFGKFSSNFLIHIRKKSLHVYAVTKTTAPTKIVMA
jgi:hypothetical protein